MEEYSIKIERNGYVNILTLKTDTNDLTIKEIVKMIYEKLGDSVDLTEE